MGPADRRRRLIDQYSYRGPSAAAWQGFDAILDTDAYLNLGSARNVTDYLTGRAQHRLAREVGRTLAGAGIDAGDRLVDVGCGRGGPTIQLERALGARAVGVDLVPFNVRMARLNALEAAATAQFLRGEASALPLCDASVDAAVAIDSLVYIGEVAPVFAELARVLTPGGVGVVTDLIRRDDVAVEERALIRFGETWDIPAVGVRATYLEAIAANGLVVDDVTDIRRHSLDVVEPWARRFVRLARGPLSGVFAGTLARLGVDPDAATDQITAASAVLPALTHVKVRVRRPM